MSDDNYLQSLLLRRKKILNEIHSLFFKKVSWSAHLFNGHYLSIPSAHRWERFSRNPRYKTNEKMTKKTAEKGFIFADNQEFR